MIDGGFYKSCWMDGYKDEALTITYFDWNFNTEVLMNKKFEWSKMIKKWFKGLITGGISGGVVTGGDPEMIALIGSINSVLEAVRNLITHFKKIKNNIK